MGPTAKVGDSKDVQSGLLEEIELMDYRAELPEGDPRYSSYVDSLIAYFERNRKVRQDLLSAIALGTFDASKPVPTLPSLASVPDGGSQNGGQGQGGNRGGGNQRGGRGANRDAQTSDFLVPGQGSPWTGAAGRTH